VTAYNLQEHRQYQRSRSEATLRSGGVLGRWRVPVPGAVAISVRIEAPARCRRRVSFNSDTGLSTSLGEPRSPAKPAARGSAAHRTISWLRRAEILPPDAAEPLSLSGPQDGFDAESEGRHPD
jgi:hypothetical protein